MGCGFEPPPPDNLRPYVVAWEGARTLGADERDASGRVLLPVCPGYACQLPEVIEASHAVAWKQHGELTQFLEGATCTRDMREAITLIEIEQGRVQAYAMKEQK